MGTIVDGRLLLNEKCGSGDASFYVGAVNPFATYEIDIHSINHDGDKSTEVGFELARLGLKDRVQLFVRSSSSEKGVYLRVYKNGEVEREEKYTDTLPENDFKLRAQLYGHSLAAFCGKTRPYYISGIRICKDEFQQCDRFSFGKGCEGTTFNVISNLKGSTLISGARSYLSTGIGQADIRLISYEDLSPYMDDNRLWFTFSCRGVDIFQSAQGVLSVDPSVFDVKFEGMIVFDHGDGLLLQRLRVTSLL